MPVQAGSGWPVCRRGPGSFRSSRQATGASDPLRERHRGSVTYWGLSRSFWSRVMYSSGVMLPFSSRTEFAPASAVNFALGERASNQSTLDLAVAMSLATSVVYPGNRGGAAPGVGAARTGGWLALKPEYAV